MNNNLIVPECDTLFSYALKCHKSLTLETLSNVSNQLLTPFESDLKMSPDFWEYNLLKEVKESFSVIHQLFKYFHNRHPRNWVDFPEIVINDIDCGQGLYSLAIILSMFNEVNISKIKSVNLISSDRKAVSRALLYYSLFCPSVKVKYVLKDAETIDKELLCDSIFTINILHNFTLKYTHPSIVLSDIYKKSHFLYSCCLVIEEISNLFNEELISSEAFNIFATQLDQYCKFSNYDIFTYNTNKKSELNRTFSIALFDCSSLQDIKTIQLRDPYFTSLCPGTFIKTLINHKRNKLYFEQPLEDSPLLDELSNYLKVSLNDREPSEDYKNKYSDEFYSYNLDPHSCREIASKFHQGHLAHALKCKMDCGKQILDLYFYAASKGNPECYNNIAVLYLYAREDLFGENYEEEAIKYLKIAMSEGSACAAFNLACLYFEKEQNEEAIECLKIALKKDYIIAIFNLALIYHFGLYDEDIDVNKSILLYKKVINLYLKDCDKQNLYAYNSSILNLMLLYYKLNKDFIYIADLYASVVEPNEHIRYAYNTLTLLEIGYSSDEYFNLLRKKQSSDNEPSFYEFNRIIAKHKGFSTKKISVQKDEPSALSELEHFLAIDANDWPDKELIILPVLAHWYYCSNQFEKAKELFLKAANLNTSKACSYLTNIQLIEKSDDSIWQRFAMGEGCLTCNEYSCYNENKRRCPKAMWHWGLHLKEIGDSSAAESIFKAAVEQRHASSAYELSAQKLINSLVPKEKHDVMAEPNFCLTGSEIPLHIKPIIPYLSQPQYKELITLSAEEGNRKAKKLVKHVAKSLKNKLEFYYWVAINGNLEEMFEAISEITSLRITGDYFEPSSDIEKDFIFLANKIAENITDDIKSIQFTCNLAAFYLKGDCNQTALKLYNLAKGKGADVDLDIALLKDAIEYENRIYRRNYHNDYYDYDYDYRQETWYALTDGMYGDMPDGFDGDYDFLGF